MARDPDVSFFILFRELDPRNQRQCIFFNRKGQRCKCPAGDRARAIQLYEDITAEGDGEVSLGLLKEYIKCNCCVFARHRDRIEDTSLLTPLAERWQDEIYAGRARVRPPRYSLRSRAVTAPESPLGEFRPYKADPTRANTVFHKICEILSGRDFEKGSLYVFDRDESPGHVKIGWTAVPVAKRLKIWSRCGYTPNLLFSVGDVPNARRAETLTHNELLKEWRSERSCKAKSCGKSHQEWFEISPERAAQVLGHWARFFQRAEPYDAEGQLKQQWREVVGVIDRKGEPVTAEMMLRYYTASLDGNATTTENDTNPVFALNTERVMSSTTTPKLELRTDSEPVLKIEETIKEMVTSAVTEEVAKVFKETISKEVSLQVEKLRISIEAALLESTQMLPKQVSPTEAVSLKREEAHSNPWSQYENNASTQTDPATQDEPLPKFRSAPSSYPPVQIEPSPNPRLPSKTDSPSSVEASSRAEPLRKTEATSTTEQPPCPLFLPVRKRSLESQSFFQSELPPNVESLLNIKGPFSAIPLWGRKVPFDDNESHNTQHQSALEPAIKTEPKNNNESPIRIAPDLASEPTYKNDPLPDLKSSSLAEKLPKAEFAFNSKSPSKEFSFMCEPPNRNETPAQNLQYESLFSGKPTLFKCEPRLKTNFFSKTSPLFGGNINLESFTRTESLFKNVPLTENPFHLYSTADDKANRKSCISSSSTSFKFESPAKDDSSLVNQLSSFAQFEFGLPPQEESLFELKSLRDAMSKFELTKTPIANSQVTVESLFGIQTSSESGPSIKTEARSEGDSMHGQASTLENPAQSKTPQSKQTPQTPITPSQPAATLSPPSAAAPPSSSPSRKPPRTSTTTTANSTAATNSLPPNSPEPPPDPSAAPSPRADESTLDPESLAPVVTEMANALLSLSPGQQDEIAGAIASLSRRERDVAGASDAESVRGGDDLAGRGGRASGVWEAGSEGGGDELEDETLLGQEGWGPDEPTLVVELASGALEEEALKIADKLAGDVAVEAVSVAVEEVAGSKTLEGEVPPVVGAVAIA